MKKKKNPPGELHANLFTKIFNRFSTPFPLSLLVSYPPTTFLDSIFRLLFDCHLCDVIAHRSICNIFMRILSCAFLTPLSDVLFFRFEKDQNCKLRNVFFFGTHLTRYSLFCLVCDLSHDRWRRLLLIKCTGWFNQGSRRVCIVTGLIYQLLTLRFRPDASISSRNGAQTRKKGHGYVKGWVSP